MRGASTCAGLGRNRGFTSGAAGAVGFFAGALCATVVDAVARSRVAANSDASDLVVFVLGILNIFILGIFVLIFVLIMDSDFRLLRDVKTASNAEGFRSH